MPEIEEKVEQVYEGLKKWVKTNRDIFSDYDEGKPIKLNLSIQKLAEVNDMDTRIMRGVCFLLWERMKFIMSRGGKLSEEEAEKVKALEERAKRKIEAMLRIREKSGMDMPFLLVR